MNTTSKRSVYSIFFVIALLFAGSITAVAGYIQWAETPVIERWFDAGTKSQPVLFECWVFRDGSAEFKITPKVKLTGDKALSSRLITVNGKIFEMSVRIDKEERTCLYGVVPVGTFTLDENISYTLKAFDGIGTLLVDDAATNSPLP